MVILMVDEAAAFDALSILEVKQEKLSLKGLAERERLVAMLKHQLGEAKFCDVVNSPEFIRLHKVNATIWDLVDQAQSDRVLASAVVNKNHDRFQSKRELQRRWFSLELEERKG